MFGTTKVETCSTFKIRALSGALPGGTHAITYTWTTGRTIQVCTETEVRSTIQKWGLLKRKSMENQYCRGTIIYGHTRLAKIWCTSADSNGSTPRVAVALGLCGGFFCCQCSYPKMFELSLRFWIGQFASSIGASYHQKIVVLMGESIELCLLPLYN